MNGSKIEKNNSLIDVAYVAQLARLELDSDTLDELQKDMENIVKYVNLLGELDLNDVEPTAHPVSSSNVWRQDCSEDSYTQEVMLKNAPAVLNDELIKVPQVISGEEEI